MVILMVMVMLMVIGIILLARVIARSCYRC